MAVTKAKKAEILDQLKEVLKEAKSVGFTTNVGLTMADFNSIRSNLRTAGGKFMLAKKTLIKLAMKEIHGVDVELDALPGQVAVITSTNDAVAGLGKVNEAMKEIIAKKGGENKIKWVLSFFEGKIQNEAETIEIAAMPSRETLLGRLVGSMQSPIAGLARFFDAAAKKLETENMANLSSAPAPKKEAAPAPVAEVKEEAPVAVEETAAPVVAEEVAVEAAPEVAAEAPVETVAEVVAEAPAAPTEEVAAAWEEEAPKA